MYRGNDRLGKDGEACLGRLQSSGPIRKEGRCKRCWHCMLAAACVRRHISIHRLLTMRPRSKCLPFSRRQGLPGVTLAAFRDEVCEKCGLREPTQLEGAARTARAQRLSHPLFFFSTSPAWSATCFLASANCALTSRVFSSSSDCCREKSAR